MNPSEVPPPLSLEEPLFSLDQNASGNPVSPSCEANPLRANHNGTLPNTASQLNFDPEATLTMPIESPQPQVLTTATVQVPAVSTDDNITPPTERASFGAADFAALKDATAAALTTTNANVSKEELALVLDGFARVLRGEVVDADQELSDKAAENAQLRELLLEAQETIITLLNDRVFDRATIARLESEMKLLPDLQSQASRAMGIAMKSEDLEKELTQVKAEVERLRTSYIKSDQGWFRRWFGLR
jgi:hypothetical protein